MTREELDKDMIESIEMWLHEIEPKWVEKELAWLEELRTRLLKEETPNGLEEAAKKYAEGIVQREDALMCKQAFIAGAEWQAKCMKDEEEKELSEKIAAAYQLGIKDKEQKSMEGLDEVAKAYALDTAEDSEQYSARYLGYKDGAKWQKQEMLKEARNHFVYNILSGNDMKKMIELYNDEVSCKPGDVVRIIIVKED